MIWKYDNIGERTSSVVVIFWDFQDFSLTCLQRGPSSQWPDGLTDKLLVVGGGVWLSNNYWYFLLMIYKVRFYHKTIDVVVSHTTYNVYHTFKSNQIKWNRIKSNEIKTKSNQNQIKIKLKSNQQIKIKSNEIKWNQNKFKTNQIKWNQIINQIDFDLISFDFDFIWFWDSISNSKQIKNPEHLYHVQTSIYLISCCCCVRLHPRRVKDRFL